MEVTDINTALKTLNAVEDRRDMLRLNYERKDKALKQIKDQLDAYLLQEMKNLGLTAFEVPGEGIAKIKVKRRFGCADWGIFWNWIVDNKCPNILQKRILDSEMQTYLESSGGLPPGISTEARMIIDVDGRPPK